MQLPKQDNVTYAAIADTTAVAAADGALASPSTIPDGACALVNEGAIVLNAAAYTALTADRQVRIVQNISGKLFFSCDMTKGKLRTGKSNKSGAPTASGPASISIYSAEQQQITRIGYNGTTGTLPVANDTEYWIKLRKNDNDAANRSQPTSLFAGPVKTDATGTQEELALALTKSGIKNMSTQPASNNGYVIFETLNGGARSAATATGAVTLTFTKGSKSVAASAATASTNVVAGDYISIAAATTTGVYKVTAKDGSGNLTLETAYQSATVAIVASAASIRIANAAAIAADGGVQISGVVSDFDVNAFRNYYSNRFTATFSDTTVLNTHVQGALEGTGVWQEAAMAEYMSMGNQGENQMLSVPPKLRTSSVVTDGEYAVLTLIADEDIHGLTSKNTETSTVMLYIQDGSGSPSGLAIAVALGFAGGDLI